MALPLILQAIGGGLLGQGLYDAYRNIGADKRRAGLLGTMPTPSTMTPIPPVGPPTAQGIMPESEGNVVTPGKAGSGLLGSLYGMNPQVAEQLAPLLQQMPGQDLQAVSRGLVGSIATPKNDPLSGIAKLQADLSAGRITPDQYQIAVQALNKPAVNINQFPNPPQGMAYANPSNPMQGLVDIPGGPSDPNSPNFKWTEGEMLAGGYANRMLGAEDNMAKMVGQGFDPASTIENLRAGVPLIGNYLASSEYQQYRQAQEDWVRAKLRKESGAVIADEEMEREIKTYFPQPGDGPAVVAQKEKARREAAKGMAESSRGYLERRLRRTRPDLPDPEEYLRSIGLD